LLTQCISNSQSIRADSARVDWSNAVQASSVQVPKNWGLVRSRAKNFLDWTWTRLDGSSPDWSIAGLVESLEAREQTDFNCDDNIKSGKKNNQSDMTELDIEGEGPEEEMSFEYEEIIGGVEEEEKQENEEDDVEEEGKEEGDRFKSRYGAQCNCSCTTRLRHTADRRDRDDSV